MGQLKTIALLLALLASSGAGAQQKTYKCTDKVGKVTYSTTECHLLGLRAQGEVVDRMNTSPAYKAPAPSSTGQVQYSGPGGGSRPAPAAASQGGPAPEGDSGDPKRRCFTVKTAKGVSTRCNDQPEEEAPK